MLRKKLYKDMAKFQATKRAQTKRWRERTGSGKYAIRKWTAYEDKLVLEHKMSDRELGKKIQRSVSSIYSRRVRLKHQKAEAEQFVRELKKFDGTMKNSK